MEEQLKSGTSINHRRQLDVDTRTTLSTFKAMVDLIILQSLAPTLTGGNFLDLMVNTLSMSRTRRLLMLKEEKTLKVKLYGHGEDITVSTRDGLFFTLQIEKLIERRE
jgi:hypothetical protein